MQKLEQLSGEAATLREQVAQSKATQKNGDNGARARELEAKVTSLQQQVDRKVNGGDAGGDAARVAQLEAQLTKQRKVLKTLKQRLDAKEKEVLAL